MRKMMVLAVMVALAALMLAAAPAMASPKDNGSKGAHEGNWHPFDNNGSNWNPFDNNDGNRNRVDDNDGNRNRVGDNDGNRNRVDDNNGNCHPFDNNDGNRNRVDDNNGNCHPFDNVPQQIQVPTQTFVSGANTINGGTVNSTGDNSNTCVATQNFNNSGGLLEQPSTQQFHSLSGSDISIGGTFINAPQQNVTCNPSVQQSASSSSGWNSGWNSGWST